MIASSTRQGILIETLKSPEGNKPTNSLVLTEAMSWGGGGLPVCFHYHTKLPGQK